MRQLLMEFISSYFKFQLQNCVNFLLIKELSISLSFLFSGRSLKRSKTATATCKQTKSYMTQNIIKRVDEGKPKIIKRLLKTQIWGKIAYGACRVAKFQLRF